MMKCDNLSALKIALELAKVNLESAEEWTHPEDVEYFIERIYSFLTEGKTNNE